MPVDVKLLNNGASKMQFRRRAHHIARWKHVNTRATASKFCNIFIWGGALLDIEPIPRKQIQVPELDINYLHDTQWLCITIHALSLHSGQPNYCK